MAPALRVMQQQRRAPIKLNALYPWVGALALLVAVPARAGDIYACKGKDGVTAYQNMPCTNAKTIGHGSYSDAMARPPAQPAYTSRPLPAAGNAYSYVHAPTRPSEPVRTGGIGTSAYAQGKVQGMRCVTAAGKVYYASGACSTSVRAIPSKHDWHNDEVQGMPGAVMINPEQALDPSTGRVVNLYTAPMSPPTVITTRDQGTSMSANDACAGARRLADGRFSQKADARVQALCQRGRSLYDEPPAAGIPQNGGGIP